MELRSSHKDIIYSLPLEIWEIIFEYLNVSELLSCRLVSSSWNAFLYQRKLLWTKIFKMNGLVCPKGEAFQTLDAYKTFYSRMKARLNEMKSGQCFLLESLPQRLDNYPRYYIQAFYRYESLIGVATSDGFLRIYNVSRKPTRILQIELFNFMCAPCISMLRLHDSNVVVIDRTGSIPAFNTHDGQCVAINIVENVDSFDLLKGTLIVACGGLGCVKIIDLVRDEAIVAETNVSMHVFDVLLTRHWSENPESEPKIILLFCMDSFHVYVQKIMNFTSATNHEAKSVNCLYTIPLKSSSFVCDVKDLKPLALSSICYDGLKYLYFSTTGPYTCTGEIYKFNIQSGESKMMDLGLPLIQLVAAGKTNLAFSTRDETFQHFKLRVIDIHTNKCRITCLLTREIRLDFIPWNQFSYEYMEQQQRSCMGDTSWLDGFNGFNDSGLICVYLQSINTLKMVQWTEKSS